jgi:hypothetical protein
MLKASVGSNGTNNKLDVTYIQKLLNGHSFAKLNVNMQLLEDGICGKKTIATITKFQVEVVGIAKPDGRVDPGGRTIKILERASGGISQVPLVASVGIKVNRTAKATNNQSPINVTPIATGITDPRKLKTRTALAAVYGSISEDKKWANQSQYLAGYSVPQAIQANKNYNWINIYSPKKSKVTTVYCHKAMHSFLDAALNNLVERNLLGDLREYGGCHAIRATRGTTNWSAHSWALAIDLNMTGNELGKTPTMSEEFAQCFIDAGFGWGGNFTRKDGMHFTIAGFDLPRAQ